MIIAVAPLVLAIVGLLVWVMAANPKASEAGKILFFCGVLALALSFSGKSFHIG
jgi:hypothetical protein